MVATTHERVVRLEFVVERFVFVVAREPESVLISEVLFAILPEAVRISVSFVAVLPERVRISVSFV